MVFIICIFIDLLLKNGLLGISFSEFQVSQLSVGTVL